MAGGGIMDQAAFSPSKQSRHFRKAKNETLQLVSMKVAPIKKMLLN